jgi:hypothetical protein
MPKKSTNTVKKASEQTPKNDVQDEPKRPHDRSLSDLLDMSMSMPVTPIKKRSKRAHLTPSISKKPMKKHVASKGARKPKSETKKKTKPIKKKTDTPKKKKTEASKKKTDAPKKKRTSKEKAA